MEIEIESFNEELDGIDELASTSYADAAAKYNALATAPMEDGERGMKKVEVVFTRAATLFAKLGKAGGELAASLSCDPPRLPSPAAPTPCCCGWLVLSVALSSAFHLDGARWAGGSTATG